MGHLPGCECSEFGCPLGLHGCLCGPRRRSIVISYLAASAYVRPAVTPMRVMGVFR